MLFTYFDLFNTTQIIYYQGPNDKKPTMVCTCRLDNLSDTLTEMAHFTKQLKIKPILIPTGIKCSLDPNTYLELSVRSSTPLKHWIILANGVGIIDADYYNNPDNEGHIYFQVINLSTFDIQLKKGDKIGQGIIKHYLITDDDNASGQRLGGFGSTTSSPEANQASLT